MVEQTLERWLTQDGASTGLFRVDKCIDPYEYEATAILAQIEQRSPAPPPVVFSRTVGLDGEPSQFPLVFNAYGSLRSVATTLGFEAKKWADVLTQFQTKVTHTSPPVRLNGDAAVQQEVRTGEALDLRILPWTRHVVMDGGPYLTPVVVACDLNHERYNISWNRVMYLDRNHVAIHLSPRHLWSYQRAAEERNEELLVAIILGHHPAFNLAAAALSSIQDDEYHIASALLGERLRITPSRSYGDRLLVPADADIVIEGRMLPARRAVEGPFGEFMGYVGPQKLSHVVEVDALTWRPGGRVLEIFTSHADHYNAHIAIEASLLQRSKVAVPQVTGVSWFRGGGPTTIVVSMAKSAEGQPQRAAFAVMSAGNTIKQVIVVDDDINIDDPRHVMWAVSTRTRAEEDINLLRGLQGHLLDPSQVGYGKTSGFVIDATKPVNHAFPPQAAVPDWAIAKFPLDNYKITKEG